MQDPQQPKGWTPVEDARNAASFFAFASRVLSAPVEVFLRTGFGSRYFGLPSLVAVFAIPLWMLFWPGESGSGIMLFWSLYLLMQLRAWVESARMVARGEIVHTRYNGWPRLARCFRRHGEREIKGAAEPLVVFGIGIGLLPLSLPLGSYLMTASVALAVNHGLMEAVERARALEINDALIEQRSLSEKFRGMQNGRE